MEPQEPPDANWRELMSRDDRIKVCQHIMAKLTACYHPTVPTLSLREKTSAFESQAYARGESRRDYLHRIAAGLSNVERQVVQQKKNAALAQQRAAASTATTTSNPVQQMHAAAAARQMPPQQASAAHQLQQHQQMISMVNPMSVQQLQRHMIQQQQDSKQTPPPQGFPNPQSAAEAKASSARARISSSSVASAAAASRPKAQTQSIGDNPVTESDIARVDTFNPAGQVAHLSTDLNREILMGVNAQNAASRQNLRQQQALQALYARRPQAQPKQATASQQANAANLANFFPRDPNPKSNQEQLNQLLAMSVQGSMAPGTSSGLPPGVNAASLALGQMGSRAMNAQMLQQQLRMQQGANLQAAAAASAGNPSYVARATRAATGMSVSQMSACMAQSYQNGDMRGSQEQYNTMERSRLAAAQAAANQRIEQSRPGAAGSEEFWAKLEEMKLKYKGSLKELYPYMSTIANGQRPEKKDQFKKHVKDCFQILELSRGNQVPPTLNTALLEKACKFIDSVIDVIKTYIVKDRTGKASASRPHQQAAVPPPDNKINPSQYAMAQNIAVAQSMAAAQRQDADSHAAAQREMMYKIQQQQQQQQRQSFTQHQQARALAAANRQFPDGAKVAAKAATSGAMPNFAPPGAAVRQSPKKVNSGQAAQLAAPVKQDPYQTARVGVAQAGILAGGLTEDPNMALQRTTMMHARAMQAGRQIPRGFSQQAAMHQNAMNAKNASQQAAMGAQEANLSRMMMSNQQLPKHLSMTGSRSQGQMPIGHAMTAPASTAAELHRGGVQVKSESASVVPSKESMASALARSQANLGQSLRQMEAKAKKICDQTVRWEAYVNTEMKRSKAERIQNTLTALRNANRSSDLSQGNGIRGKRSSSLVDVDNCPEDEKVIRSNSVFECSSDQGLRLAKRPKNDSVEINSAREAVEADCRAAEEKNPLLALNVRDDYGQPVVECMIMIEEIKLPKLILRVQRGYPRKGGATYGFERPPLGWTGVVGQIRNAFKNTLANAPTSQIGVGTFLDAWARQAEAVVDAELRCTSSELSFSEDEKDDAASLLENASCK